MSRGELSALSWTLCVTCAVTLSTSTPYELGAQGAAPTLTIDSVIDATLKENHDIRQARMAADAEGGIRTQAARPFDPNLTARLTGSRSVNNDGSTPTSSASTLLPDFQLGLAKMFRVGAMVTSDVQMQRTLPAPGNNAAFNRFTFSTGVTVPLMQGKRGGLASAVERAAFAEYSASEHSLRAAASAAVRAAAAAYWEYRAACQRADILRAAAQRAQRSVDEVTILIAADERPRSDIDLMIANAAIKHAAQIESERQIAHARNMLGRAMGVDFAATAALGMPATALPNPDATAPLPLDRLVVDALADHAEVVAASMRQQSARLLRDGAARYLVPRLDLVLGTSYTSRQGGGGAVDASQTLSNGGTGGQVSVQFVFEPSTFNSGIRGALMEADARVAQATIGLDRLERRLRIDVADALGTLDSSRARRVGTREAVARSRLAMETVRRNFELGAATLFDRILAEDTVTNAELADLAANLQFAQALVELQFARGVLVHGSGRDLSADPRRVLSAALEDAR